MWHGGSIAWQPSNQSFRVCKAVTEDEKHRIAGLAVAPMAAGRRREAQRF